jgi:ion channel POLLUX/CASTOR
VLIGWLVLFCLAIVVVASGIVVLAGIREPEASAMGFVEAAWQALVRTLDPGTMGADAGWAFRVVMLGVTLGGIVVLSTLIGVITTGIDGRMQELRRGRSPVLETGHTLVIGWSRTVATLIGELALANANVRRPRVVVVAEGDRVTMEESIRARVGAGLGRTKVICRSADPLSPEALIVGNPGAARSIVVLGPDEGDADGFVLRAIMALSRTPHRPAGANHIVAVVEQPGILAACALVGGPDVELISVHDFVARIIAQTCRQSGLSVVYRELLSFEGAEIYFVPEPVLAGMSYGDTLLAYEDSCVIGIHGGTNGTVLNPPPSTVLGPGDELVVLAEDDDTTRLPHRPVARPDTTAIVPHAPVPTGPEHTLVLGWNEHGARVVRELDHYVAPGSRVDIVEQDGTAAQDGAVTARLRHLTVTTQVGDPADRDRLEALDLGGYDHVILLADTAAVDGAATDTQTLLALLHLRDLAQRQGHPFSIVTEIVDPRNRELAGGARADDFIVSDELVSLVLAQVSERAELGEVLAGLFDAEGTEIYLRPAADYVVLGRPVTFSTVVAAARSRSETAIGYRSGAEAEDPAAGFGVRLNPAKSAARVWTEGDRVIVLAED